MQPGVGKFGCIWLEWFARGQGIWRQIFEKCQIPTPRPACLPALPTPPPPPPAGLTLIGALPSQINMGDWPKRMSCPSRRFGEEFCQLREKKMEKVEWKRKTDKDLYDVEVVEVDTTRKQLKIPFVEFSHEYDEWCDYITIIKGINFPSFAWKKCFSPMKVHRRIEATFFMGNCIVFWFLQYLLNYVCKSRFSGLFLGLWNGIN